MASSLAMPDAVAAPKKPFTAERTQSDEVFLCELGALCGEKLLNGFFEIA